MITGNTFTQREITISPARKVWREIRHRYPAGGIVTNFNDFLESGKIPAGTPVSLDQENKTIQPIPDSVIEETAGEDIATLNINGYIQEDVPVKSENDVCSGTVIYAGELYEWAVSSASLEKLRLNPLTPMIIWVR